MNLYSDRNWRQLVPCILLTLFVLFQTSCKKDENNHPAASVDISGFWIVEEESTGNCSGTNETEYATEIYSIKQTGSSLEITLYPNGDILNGQIRGNKIDWAGTIPTVNGNLDISFSGTVTSDGSEVEGLANWEWYDDSYSCSGTSEALGEKVVADTVDFSGTWNGAWESEENYIEGTFTANVSQSNGELSGTISVPEIGMENATLTGMVNGNVVFFGDVDGKIKFVGRLNDQVASGEYSYMALTDEGSWSATKGEGAISSSLVLIESFNLGTGYIACKDMTYDGEKFYYLSEEYINIIYSNGELAGNKLTPGSYPDGIAFDGTHLLVGDNGWGTNKIYKLDPDQIGINSLPGGRNTIGVEAFEDGFWLGSGEYDDPRIYRTDITGQIINVIEIDGTTLNGLCFDGEYLWISYTDFTTMDFYKMAKLDTEGNFLKTFTPPIEAGGVVAFDGIYLWFAADEQIHKIDTSGNLLKSIDAPSSEGMYGLGGLTFDGQYLWCATNGFGEPGEVVCLDTLGNIISSFETPGENSVGLAYDGTNLWLADYVTERMYSFPTDGDYFLPYPSVDFNTMCATGDNIYVYNSYDEEIVTLNSTGDIIDEFYISLDWSGNFYYDEEYFWSAENFLSELSRIIKFDGEGNIVESYVPNESIMAVSALVVIDNEIWCINGNDERGSFLSRFGLAEVE